MVKIYPTYLFLFLLLLVRPLTKAQNFGDEWIQSGKPYYKIKVAENGLYKVSYEVLKNNGAEEGFFQTQKLQLWHRGKLQHLSIKGGAELGPGDYFVFYGMKNDGAQDSLLYYPATPLYNKYANLFSDTTAYFLTFSEQNPSPKTDTLSSQDYSNPSSTFTVNKLKTYFDYYWWCGYIDPLVTHFQPGEGWTKFTNYKDTTTEKILIEGYVPGMPTLLEILVSDQENLGFNPTLSLLSKSGNPLVLGNLTDLENLPYGAARQTFELPIDLNDYLHEGRLKLFINHTGQGIISTFYVHVTYQKDANLTGIQKQLFWTSNPVQLKNAKSSAFYGVLQNNSLQSWVKEQGATLPRFATHSHVFYTEQLDSVSTLQKISFSDYPATDSLYLIITNRKLLSSAQKYAGYRRSPKGGSYDTLVVDIQQVFDQFSYGEKTPLGIRRFLNRIKSKNINAPDHLFLIGTAVQLDYQQANRQNPSLPVKFDDMVLTAGVPGGDFVFSIGLDGTASSNTYNNLKFLYPTVATGRLSAPSNQLVLDYLEKVKEHENVSPTAPWLRNILHLSGGFSSGASAEANREQARVIRTYMSGFESIIRQPFLGATVKTFGRQTNAANEIIDVSGQVNQGVSLITFLGHSSQSDTDISIGLVSDSINGLGYNNKGKYPMLYLNGCLVGNTFQPEASQGVPASLGSSLILNWILTKNRGAILAYSNSGVSYVQQLKKNIENTYISLFLDSSHLAKPTGEKLRESHKRFYEVLANPGKPDPAIVSMLENATLQGDPAVHLIPTTKAEYEPICERIALHAQIGKVNAVSDSFEIAIPIKNTGLYPRQSFEISVVRRYSNNTKSIPYPYQTFLPVRSLDTVKFKIKGALLEAAGQNTFEITIDPENKLPEYDKGNNRCVFATYIPGISLKCISPKKYSIVNRETVSFVAQSPTPSTQQRTFLFELDTNHRFTSPYKKSFTVATTNLATWADVQLLPAIPENDSTVYYWRVKFLEPLATEDTAFSYSSFIYIRNSPEGWSQSKLPQFYENEARAIKLDSNSGIWSLQKLSAPLKITSLGAELPEEGTGSTLYFKNFPMVTQKLCYFNGIYILTLDPIDFKTRWASPDENNYLYACDYFQSPFITRLPNNPEFGREDFKFHPKLLLDVLKNKVQKGETIALMTIRGAPFPFPDSLNMVLKQLYGASNGIDTLKNGSPYILVARKGFGKIAEKLPKTSEPLKEALVLDTNLYSLGRSGFISSTLIGPALEWGSFFRKFQKKDLDSIRFDITGIDTSGKETTLLYNLGSNNYSLSSIDSKKHPFIRLNAFVQTQTLHVPQLKSWQVIFKGSPEGSIIINETATKEYASFTKQEGDSTKVLTFTFKNISDQPFLPNLLVRYRIVNENKTIILYDTLKKSLLPDSVWRPSFRVRTVGLQGNNTLEVFFNPEPGQKEEYRDNNSYVINFDVTGDKTHPILEVAFDGVRIMNGEIVSPSPTISISLQDENKFLALKDTSSLRVEIARPCGRPNCPFESVYLGGHNVVSYPSSNGNKFELRYKPDRLPDGVYTLRIQAKDASGNLSGTKPYLIQFEVVNEIAVTNFLPYPNPFSSKMWFVYTLTGELPDQLRIQIMTVTGKIVKTIFMEELGPLKIGTHRTDYVWDGTDDFGDQLANGLYLYKVNVRKNGEELKHRNTVNDNLFKNGYGKLYILR